MVKCGKRNNLGYEYAEKGDLSEMLVSSDRIELSFAP
jgi:hypothetical protein